MNALRLLKAAAMQGLGDRWAPTPRADDTLTNCVVFGQGTLQEALGVDLTFQELQRAMLWDANNPWSSVELWVDLGHAQDCSQSLVTPGCVYAWQLWRGLDPPTKGHFGIAWVQPEGQVLFLDATSANRSWAREAPAGTTVAQQYKVAPTHVRALRFF